MDGSNLLSGGIDTLNEIKDNLLELHGYETKSKALQLEEETLEKNINSLEKTISDEIQSTIRKRRQEIEDTFDEQTGKIEAKVKRTKERRDKRKSRKVSERIDRETATLREENGKLRQEAKELLKQKHIPAFCNTKGYVAIFAPQSFSDFLVILAALFLTLFVIPCGIYFYLLPEERIFYLILLYIVTVVAFGGIYFLIEHLTKEKYPEQIRQMIGLRNAVRINMRKISVIKRGIRKDKDESTYGLEDFDAELADLEKEAAEITEQKKEALSVFDNSASQVIAAEIKSLYEDKLLTLKTDYEKASAENKKAEDRIKSLTIKIASEYEPYIGKDLMVLDKLDSLINIIQAGSAVTISEAIAFYRQSMNTALHR